MARWEDFRTCPGCGLDLATGEGERGCSWGECPYLPGDLDVYCEQCRFNYYTQEGNPTCEDPMTCEHAAEPLAHVENLKRWRAAHVAAEKVGEAARSAPGPR
jgi:hypothetical protein